MKLATLKDGTPDGRLVVVSRDLTLCTAVPDIAPTLQSALDDWARTAPLLARAYGALEAGQAASAQPFDATEAAAPLPRAYQFVDGSFYTSHLELMSRWRGIPVPPLFFEEPFAYQGCSDGLLGPCDPIPLIADEWGLDFEAEVAVIVDAVPVQTPASAASAHVTLVMLCNDISLRNLIPRELSKEFGFYQSKPHSAFSPVAVTPDELTPDWNGNHLRLPLRTTYNGVKFGHPDAGGEAPFGFKDLIAHLAKTRSLAAGTILGSGTVSNRDRSVGSSCLAERRAMEIVETGAAVTPWMKVGDRVRIEMLDHAGRSIFGAIDQEVVRPG
jgi:fumarylacetoacetate (FAA) hydrolase